MIFGKKEWEILFNYSGNPTPLYSYNKQIETRRLRELSWIEVRCRNSNYFKLVSPVF